MNDASARTLRLAPALSADRWFNTPRPLTAADLDGKVVLLYAFQMLCPLCVHEATPLVNRVHRLTRDRPGIEVVGLHTVFENHEAMGPQALAGYLGSAGVRFPVGVDRHEPGHDAPVTMRRLQLIGTPSFVPVDRQGVVRDRIFGVLSEQALISRLERMQAEAG
ncbi:TlpA family protein disulfide reductase [Kineosporia sp. J2-2]|uniref:TlpA family protein disulfide reductase n=1 Tax=Kineosporia corallincola TaxID=2835133 RepID=A0ABS5TNM4_9ACTN|nr:TlpA disulfide reductase family protein [Kineosporia corallincola]MBT0771989.1 TlpA family protein disulfide reductase [Kineosporia corallincola]